MRTAKEQIDGLLKLARLVGKSECNCLLHHERGDVAFLYAAHTPNPSQVVYASGGYDVWTNNGGGLHLQASDLSIKDAAKVVVAEYHLAKAARIKARDPSMDTDTIMKKLAEGYQ